MHHVDLIARISYAVSLNGGLSLLSNVSVANAHILCGTLADFDLR